MAKSKNKPQAGAPMSVDDLEELPLMPNGEYNFAVLGLAESTVQTRKEALKMFNTYRKLVKKSLFEDMSPREVSADNVQQILWEFAAFVVSHPIPKNYLEGFAAPNVNSVSILTMGTIVKVLYAVKNSFREKAPDNECWPKRKADNPEWFTLLMKQATKQYQHNKNNKWSKNPDLTFGGCRTKAIYMVANPVETEEDKAEKLHWYQKDLTASGGDALDSPQAGTDLLMIMRRAFLKAHPLNPDSYYRSCRTLVAHQKVVRGGEVKHDTWSEYEWIENLQCINTLKHMTKTLSEPLSSPLLFNRQNFLLCPFFHLGCLIVFGEGLRRTPTELSDHQDDYVFWKEQTTTSSGVARRIGEFLKANLPSTSTKSDKDCVSQKSLRQGAITEMSVHERAGLFEVCGRSGHKTGVNIDPYIDDENPARGLVGGRILAQHKTFSRPVVVPCPWWLNARYVDSFNRLLECVLQGCKVNSFFPQQSHYRLLQHLVIVQIFWLDEIKDQYGESLPWVVGMYDLARRSQLVDPNDPSKSPGMVMEEWSRCLRERENVANDGADESTMSGCSVRALFDVVGELKERVRLLQQENNKVRNDMRECFSQLGSHIVSVQKDLVATRSLFVKDKDEQVKLLHEVAALKSKTEYLKSPRKEVRKLISGDESGYCSPMATRKTEPLCPPSSGSVKVLSREEVAAAALKSNGGVHHSQSVNTVHGNVFFSAPHATSIGGNGDVQKVDVSVEVGVEKLEKKNVLEMKEKAIYKLRTNIVNQVGQDGKILLQKLLPILKEEGWFRGPGSLHDPSRRVPESCCKAKAMFRYCMEVVEFVITPQERAVLFTKPKADHPTNEDHEFYAGIRNRVMDTLLRFEGKDPTVEEATRKKTPGAAARATIGAIGKRVKKYKLVMRKSLSMGPPEKNKIDPLPLEVGHRDGLPVGTPEGNKSIRRIFAINDGPAAKKAKTDSAFETAVL